VIRKVIKEVLSFGEPAGRGGEGERMSGNNN
jgi:hypothetical protein